MNRLSRIVSILALVAVGCSGGDDPTADTAQIVDTVAETPPVPTTEPETTVAATTVTEPTTAAPTTAPAPTDTATDAPPTSDRPFVINEPATVELDDEVSAPDCSTIPRGLTELEVAAGGSTHAVRVYVPDILLAEPAPVVLNFHGLGSNGQQQADYSGYETLADTEGFIAVHPTAVETPIGTSWELTEFDDPDRDDVAFVDTLIDAVVADWCGDADRVYSTGFSNGGFFTARLVCERADRIAAAVSVAGLSHAEGCAPSRPVPYLAYHGTDDPIVPFAGDGDSPLAVLGDEFSAFFTLVMPDEFAKFAVAAGCAAEPVRTEVTDEVVSYDYDGCDDAVPMTFFELPGAAHTWPNSPLAVDAAALGVHAMDVDATVDAWEFFRQFSL